jgi:hypothetical protein
VQKRLRRFTCFGNLPKELHDHIWDLAIKNNQSEPEVHVFSVSIEEQCYRANSLGIVDTVVHVQSESYMRAPVWKTKRCLQAGWASRKSPSGYLLDYGLWFACLEPRHAVVRRKGPCGTLLRLRSSPSTRRERLLAETYRDQKHARHTRVLATQHGIDTSWASRDCVPGEPNLACSDVECYSIRAPVVGTSTRGR